MSANLSQKNEALKILSNKYNEEFKKNHSNETKIQWLQETTGPNNELLNSSARIFFNLDKESRHALFKAQYDNLLKTNKLALGKTHMKTAAVIRTLISTVNKNGLQKRIAKLARIEYKLEYEDLKTYLIKLKKETIEQQKQKKLIDKGMKNGQSRPVGDVVNIQLPTTYLDSNYPVNQAYLDVLTAISQGTLHALATFKLWEQLEKFTDNSISLDSVAKEYICQLRNVDRKVQNVNAFFDNFATPVDAMKHKESISENRGFICSKSARAARQFQPFSGNTSKLRIFQTAEKGNDRSKIVAHPKGAINALSTGK
ncbi:MAG: hypothetical protein H2069_05020 [Legionella sp.]|nr:hypothetical protein [Legionella sp.]